MEDQETAKVLVLSKWTTWRASEQTKSDPDDDVTFFRHGGWLLLCSSFTPPQCCANGISIQEQLN